MNTDHIWKEHLLSMDYQKIRLIQMIESDNLKCGNKAPSLKPDNFCKSRRKKITTCHKTFKNR